MLEVMIQPAELRGRVSAIPSKSQAHRALICSALADEPTFVGCRGESNDIAATADCLAALGAVVTRESNGYYVTPMKRERNDDAVTLPCEESGSTFRFLLPIVCALNQKASFFLKGRLPERPLSPLYEELLRHGAELSPQGANPFCASGLLKPGEYAMDGGVSSQFVSGLLFALPLLGDNSKLQLTGSIESFPYIELTQAMQKAFGVESSFGGGTFAISGGQRYVSPGTIHIEGDWSNAAFWLCAGAIGKSCITCIGLDVQSKQGDRAVLEILEAFGAKVEYGDYMVSVFGGELCGITIDARNIPDLVPILAVVGAAAKGTTVIQGASRLRGKESDRLAAMKELLRGIGADADETPDGLIIKGGVPLMGGTVSSSGDHRIAMAAAIASTICKYPILLRGAEAVNKSYPTFFEDLRRLT